MRRSRSRRNLAVAALASAATLVQNADQSLAFTSLEGKTTRRDNTPTTSTIGKCIHNPSQASSTNLQAFWARGADTGPSDETKRSGNSFLRKILPQSADEDSSRESSSAGQSPSQRKRRTGRPPSNRTRTRSSSSSARYYYSAATLNEQCPSWTPGVEADECPIDESPWGSYETAAEALGESLRLSDEQTAASKLVEDALDGFIHRHALHTMNLKITSEATSRSAVLLRGDLGDVHATFDRLSFPALKLSGGGRITAKNLSLNTASFVPAVGRFIRRWSQNFEFHAQDCVLTQEDLRTSRCIRNGLASIGTRILRNVVASDSSLSVVRIDRGARLSVSTVEILENSMLSARGVITTILGNTIPFEVRTGLRVSRGGHVLHFPGLKVILNPGPLQTLIPLHLVHEVDLDLGDNARITNVEIDGRRKQIRICATAKVTPRSAIEKVTGSKAAAAAVNRAKYAVDVGRWLTNLGRFTT